MEANVTKERKINAQIKKTTDFTEDPGNKYDTGHESGEVSAERSVEQGNENQDILALRVEMRQRSKDFVDLYDRAQNEKYEAIYSEKKSDSKRARAIKNKKSRLFVKNELANKAMAQYRIFDTQAEKYRENPPIPEEYKEKIADGSRIVQFLVGKEDREREKLTKDIIGAYASDEKDRKMSALKAMSEHMMNSPLLRGDLDISRDSVIVDNIMDIYRFYDLTDTYRHFLYQFPDYWASLSEDEKQKIDTNLRKLDLITEYGKVRYSIITNNYYKNHYNDEIGLDPGENASQEKLNLSSDLVKSFYLTKAMADLGIRVPKPEGELLDERLSRIPALKEAKNAALTTGLPHLETINDYVANAMAGREREKAKAEADKVKDPVEKIIEDIKKDLESKNLMSNAIKPQSYDSIESSLRSIREKAEKTKTKLIELSDVEAYKKIQECDPKSADFKTKIKTLFKKMTTIYAVSHDVYETMDIFMQCFRRLDLYEERQKNKALMEEKVKAGAEKIETLEVVPDEAWVQSEFQAYDNSCWATVSATIVNIFNKEDTTKQQDFLNTENNAPHEFNNELKKAYVEKQLSIRTAANILNKNDKDAVLKAELDIERPFKFGENNVNAFRSDPDNHGGNVYYMADYILKATNNKAMVKGRNYNLRLNSSMPKEYNEVKAELIKQQLLTDIHNILTVEKAPIAVLNNGHYQTIVGMKGRNLIIKDPQPKMRDLETGDIIRKSDDEVNNNKLLDIDRLFDNNTGTGVLHICYLQEINDKTMETLKQEIPDAKELYDARSQNKLLDKDDFLADEYAHTKGIDVKHTHAPDEASVEINYLTYLPKGLTL